MSNLVDHQRYPKEEAEMPEENTPESWVGKSVVVWTKGPGDAYEGPLTEVNDRGVVINYLQNLDELEAREAAGEDIEALRQEAQYVNYFFPWDEIRLIARRAEEEETRLAEEAYRKRLGNSED